MADTNENKIHFNPQSQQEIEAYRFGYNKGFEDGSEWADQNPNWINVKEKEPPESIAWDKRIFFLGLTDEGGIHKMYRLADPTICKDLENDNLYLHVTHWMPIIPIPKK